ncbi:hypothetical protein PACTADRAFT_2194 [Pachysolen tannophilus NRRL Y-2460]|uniref:DNA-binding protein RAP1 n=1 Tax=Pachysolen tannophilus NRRL Y-2460 TaxID=669874 RepID=A0A1E4TVU3_PACTA|nr:hypothetical protein PACTADRAFT_2194 [Pachysolen tannophilus NRRL Y-2460]
MTEITDLNTLFTTDDNRPYVFIVSETIQNRSEVVSLINEYGGRVLDNGSHNGKGIIFLTARNSDEDILPQGKIIYDVNFVYDSIRSKSKLDLNDYKIPTSGGDDNTAKKKAQKNNFKPEEDEMILELIRQNPTLRDTHFLFDKIIQKSLPNHTGNSIRYRYRTKLKDKLEYVYQVDEDGKLVKDVNDQYIKQTVLPKTLKSSFTAEDDYNLTKEILSNTELSLDKDNNEFVLQYNIKKFYEYMQEKYSNHTANAWRDRYRKFLSKYGITKYSHYYDECIYSGIEPESIKNFTSKAALKRERENSTTHHDDNSTSNKKRRSNEQEIITNNEEILTSEEISRPITFQDNKDDENHDNTNYFAQQALSLGDEKIQEDEQLIDKNILNSMSNTDFLAKLSFIIENISKKGEDIDTDELLKILKLELGISILFSSNIIFHVSGDLSKFQNFLDIYLKTGQNPPVDYSGIFIKEYDDIIANNFDENKSPLLEMVKLHGKKKVRFRRKFLKSLSI